MLNRYDAGMRDSDKRISYGVRRLSPLLADDMSNGPGAQCCSQFPNFSILNMRDDDDDIGAASFDQIDIWDQYGTSPMILAIAYSMEFWGSHFALDIRKVVPIMIILVISYTPPLPV